MKKIAIILAIGFFLVFFSVSAYAMALCANTDYNTFLMSQGAIGPADLINEEAYETKTQKFNLTYDLVNLTPDVLQARIELYRYLDEEGPNEGWKLEQTLSYDPPFFASIPIMFSDLKRGKTYSITLIVTTDMPNISLQDGSAPIDMTVKTVYFLWPKEHGMHLSATTSFEGEPRREHFKMKWSSAEGSAKTKVKARHSDNTENPIVESSSEGELTFSREEVWSWPADNLSSISVDALDSGGTLIGTTGFIISPIPFKDYKILPCIPAPSNPSDPGVSSPDDKTLDNTKINAVVSYKYGGAFWAIRLWSYKNGINLVNNLAGAAGADGLLCQTAITRKNARWPENDETVATMQSFTDGDCKKWENDPCGRYAPICMDDREERKHLFHWNPNQGGPQPECGLTADNQDNWGETDPLYFINHEGSKISEPIVNPNPSAILPVTYSKTIAPYQTSTSLGDESPIKFCSLFMDWLPVDDLPTSPFNFVGQPQVAMNSVFQFVQDVGDSSGIKITSRYVLHCPCAGQADCHCSDINYEGPNGEDAWDFGAAIQDWIFFGSGEVKHAYYFDPNDNDVDNCYGMVERPLCSDSPTDRHCLCQYGVNTCLAPQGWKNKLQNKPGGDEWVPYALMSTENSVNDVGAWILIYNPGVSNGNLKKGELRRIWQSATGTDVVGYVTAPMTRLDSLTDTWSDNSETVIFVGPTMDSVMEHLASYTGGVWPRTTTYSISGTVSGATSVTVACTGQTSVITSGAYTFSGLADGSTYTITPSKTGYTFSPASYTVTINGANVTGKDFTAIPVPTYSISGTVYTSSGAVFSGVTVKAGSFSTTTASNGTYTITGLANGSYTVTPSKSGYTFSPTSLAVTISGANFTGKNFTADRPLTSGVAISGSVAYHSWTYYTIAVSTIDAYLSVELTGLSANVDLYDKAPSATSPHPTTSSYTGRSINTGTTKETISHSNPTPGTWSIGVYGYAAGSYTIKATVSAQAPPAPNSIQGAVTDLQNNGIGGIEVKTGNAATTTDETGGFIFADLEEGDYTLEPSEEDAAIYTFDPPNRKIKIKKNDNPHTGQDFKATPK